MKATFYRSQSGEICVVSENAKFEWVTECKNHFLRIENFQDPIFFNSITFEK